MSKSKISFSAGSSARGNSRTNTNQTQFADKITGKVNQHIGGLVSVRGITSRRSYGNNQNMVFSINRIGGIGRSFRSAQDGAASFEPYAWPPTQEQPSLLPETIYFDFQLYANGPISDSGSGIIQLAGSPKTQWSGGNQTYFTNDSTNVEDIVDSVTCTTSGKAWRLQHVYGTGGPGTPYSPYTNYELSFPDENSFKTDLIGKQQITTFYIRSETPTASYGSFVVYNGNYAGDDRTGFNLNIEQQAGGLRLFSYDFVGGSFVSTDIATGLAYNTCHKIVVNVTYNAIVQNDKFYYIVNDGTPKEIRSWINVWRLANGFTPNYGTRILFYAPNASASPSTSALLIDGITITINDTPTPIVTLLSFASSTQTTTSVIPA